MAIAKRVSCLNCMTDILGTRSKDARLFTAPYTATRALLFSKGRWERQRYGIA